MSRGRTMTPGPTTETCGNCGRTIGRLEQAHLYDGQVVCGACYQILMTEPAPRGTPGPRQSTNKPEETVRTVWPSMFRQHPLLLVLVLIMLPVAFFSRPPMTEILLGVAGGILAICWWTARRTRLTITTHRVVLRYGRVARHESEIWHRDVRNVVVNQSIFQRLMGAGDLGISSAGQSNIEITIRGIPNPRAVRDLLNSMREL